MFLMAVSFVLVALLYICVCVKCRRRAHESFVLVILILIVNHDFLRLAHYIHIWITNLDGGGGLSSLRDAAVAAGLVFSQRACSSSLRSNLLKGNL
jgi:hypothetical protein